MQEALDILVAKMLGGRRDFVERVWRNCTLNGMLAWGYCRVLQGGGATVHLLLFFITLKPTVE